MGQEFGKLRKRWCTKKYSKAALYAESFYNAAIQNNQEEEEEEGNSESEGENYQEQEQDNDDGFDFGLDSE